MLLFFAGVIFSKDPLAIVFSTSIGWHNYRQSSNAYSFYSRLREFGMTDHQILLINPQNSGCTHKNPAPGKLKSERCNNLLPGAELDYRGRDISIPVYYDILRGKFPPGTPRRKRLPFSADRNLLIFHTGHGGNGYLKLGQASAMLDWVLRYVQIKAKQILVLTDSCMAITLWEKLDPARSQNLISIASSRFNQKSLSHGYDSEVNSPLSDQFSYHLQDYLALPQVLDRPLSSLISFQPLTKLTVQVGVVDHSRVGQHWRLADFILTKKKKAVRLPFIQFK